MKTSEGAINITTAERDDAPHNAFEKFNPPSILFGKRRHIEQYFGRKLPELFP